MAWRVSIFSGNFSLSFDLSLMVKVGMFMAGSKGTRVTSGTGGFFPFVSDIFGGMGMPYLVLQSTCLCLGSRFFGILLSLAVFSPVFPIACPVPTPGATLPAISGTDFIALSTMGSIIPSTVSRVPSVEIRSTTLTTPTTTVLPITPPATPPVTPSATRMACFFDSNFSPMAVSIAAYSAVPPVRPVTTPATVMVRVPLLS